jgi:hypothetical protein
VLFSGKKGVTKLEQQYELPYFPAYKTHPDFFVGNFRKNNDECIQF